MEMGWLSSSEQGTASVDDLERYEVIDGARIEREPMGAFESVLASWLSFLINSFAAGKKIGLSGQRSAFRVECCSRPQTSFRRGLRIICTLALSRCRVRSCLECRVGFGGRNGESHQSCAGNHLCCNGPAAALPKLSGECLARSSRFLTDVRWGIRPQLAGQAE
jgi:hypothetical protein